MIKHAESHLDHGLTTAQVEFLMEKFAARGAFFIETIELPDELGTVPCGLHGPITGDAPIADADVTHAKRGTRAWESRLVDRPAKPSRQVTVIAGPHEELCGIHDASCQRCGGAGAVKFDCILYTAFGGPLAPQEPGDPGCKDPEASKTFWAQHALTRE